MGGRLIPCRDEGRATIEIENMEKRECYNEWKDGRIWERWEVNCGEELG